jgi:Dyp-type peroxidase family
MVEVLLENQEPIDPESKQNRGLLADLQGNILKGHGRNHTIQIFLRFKRAPLKRNPQAVKDLIRMLAKKYITSAMQQHKDTVRYKEQMPGGSLRDACADRSFRSTVRYKKQIPGSPFAAFYLSAKGYEALGYTTAQMPQDAKFQAGMKNSQRELNDPSLDYWERRYRQPIHAMILMADHNPARLRRRKQAIRKNFQGVAHVFIERGKVMRNKTCDIIEHFGYVDGRSQPRFLEQDMKHEQNSGGINKHKPFAPLKLVLVKDPNGKRAASFGSYLVFRKLQQNVWLFKETVERLAAKLWSKPRDQLTPEEKRRAGALIVGRFEDGTPVTLRECEGMYPVSNNFNYDDDSDGTKCPFHAHIRRANPRVDREEERKHRIVRRGITYGTRRRNLEDRPKTGVGMLFMCFQSDIGDQFEYIHRAMANGSNLTRQGTGHDPITHLANPGGLHELKFPVKWGDPHAPLVPHIFYGYVALKGGEYFFAPSISFLKNI